MSDPAGIVRAPPLVLASLPRRLAAAVYEGLVLAAILFVAGFLTLPFTAGRDRALVLPSTLGRASVFVLVFAVLAAYCVHFWTAHRRTLAMKTWGIRLARTDGAPLRARQAFLRYVAAWIGPALALAAYALTRPHPGATGSAALLALGFAWALVDPQRQFLHDRLAGTRLVRDPRRA